MGEAKRRKAAGDYPSHPSPDDAFAAVRRFWCGRDPGAASDFRVPEGTVAITFDVEGAATSTCIINSAIIAETVDKVAAAARTLSYPEIVRLIGREFLKARKAGDDSTIRWIAIAGLWTVFNHPKSGDTIRKAVSERLQEHGKAHITWRLSPDGMALALSDQFVDDLEDIQRIVPKDSATEVVNPEASWEHPKQ